MNVCIHNSRALLPYQPETIKLQLLYTDPFCCTRIGDYDILRKCRRPAAWKKTQTKPSCIHLWCPVCQRRRARRQLESSPCRRAGLAHSKTSFKLLANSLCSLNEFTQQLTIISTSKRSLRKLPPLRAWFKSACPRCMRDHRDILH